MPPTGTAGEARAVAHDFKKIEGDARGDALAMCDKGELIDAVLRVPNLNLYRRHGTEEIAFAYGDDAPVWGEDSTG